MHIPRNCLLSEAAAAFQKVIFLISLQFTVLIHSVRNTGSHFGRREGVVYWDVSCQELVISSA